MGSAPPGPSSAGYSSRRTDLLLGILSVFWDMSWAPASSIAIWPSWPHMCAYLVVVIQGRPTLCSGMGKASMSARKATTLHSPSLASYASPVPLISTTRPVPAHALIFSSEIPNESRVSLSTRCVRCSLNAISACLWKSRLSSIIRSTSTPCASKMARCSSL
jgi:hypothetical protein